MQALSMSPITLRRVWTDYKETRDLKPITIRNYDQRLNQYLRDWLDVPITSITKSMVEERHRSIPGRAMANSTFRTLRALLHFAAVKYEDDSGAPLLRANPVRRLSELRAWHRDRHRRTVIEAKQLPVWFRAVYGLDNSTLRDYLLLLAFTGMRRSEALLLQWQNVDLQSGTLILDDTKNGHRHVVPLSDFAWRILKVRSLGADSLWVFPAVDRSKPMTAAFASYLKVAKKSGVQFCLHDIRRLFASIGDEQDLKTEVVAALLNHQPKVITERYVIRSTERLRRATQQITNRLLELGQITVR